MKVIMLLSEKIDEELEDAQEYAEEAYKLKVDHPDVADLMHKLSEEEMGHMNRLHECVVRQIEMYRKEHGEPPADMMAIYKYEHGRQMRKAADVKRMQEMYRQ